MSRIGRDRSPESFELGVSLRAPRLVDVQVERSSAAVAILAAVCEVLLEARKLPEGLDGSRSRWTLRPGRSPGAEWSRVDVCSNCYKRDGRIGLEDGLTKGVKPPPVITARAELVL